MFPWVQMTVFLLTEVIFNDKQPKITYNLNVGKVSNIGHTDLVLSKLK